MKKALMNASVASMIYKFNMNNIEILEKLGYQVDVACNFGKENPISQEQIDDFKSILRKKNIKVIETICPRNIFALRKLVKAYKQMKRIADKGNYDLVHTQSPIGGAVCRLAFRKARKRGTRVIYTAHGFHFYKGAPKKNWMVFYPIEKFLSYWTDILITINQEDYELAKKKFHAKGVKRIPGVGANTQKFKPITDKSMIEEKLIQIGIPKDAYMILSVGELNDNKNHQLVLRSIAELGNKAVHYVLVGVGVNRTMLEELATALNISEQVHFLGYRTDINSLDNCADVFAFPSQREGLGMAALEALACGTPVIGMNTRGIREYVIEGETGYLFENDVESCKKALENVLGKKKEMRQKCLEVAQAFSRQETDRIMVHLYSDILKL